MKIKRFFAPDMRRAIQQVRNEHGPDAVILSSRSVDGGAEIVSAVDYDHELVSRMFGSGRGAQAADAGAQASAEAADAADAAHGSGMAGSTDEERTAAEPATTGRGDAALRPGAGTGAAAHPGVPAASPGARVPSPPVEEAPVPAATRRTPANTIEWSQDPALQAMRQELEAMKGLLSEQFSRLSWADIKTFQPARALLMRRVAQLGLDHDLAQQIVDEVASPDDRRQAWREVMLALARRLRVCKTDPLDAGGVFALVGPTGVGKTTTIAKLAARHCLRHGRDSLALISTDCYRVGAQRQLDAFGAILGVPVRRADGPDELERQLAELRDRRLVLIDTAGMAPRDRRVSEAQRQLSSAPGLKRMLVLSANTQASVMHDAVLHFGGQALSGIALTKLDEANGLGAALSVLSATELPAVWLSDGQRVPEDLKLARVLHLINWVNDVPAPSRAVSDDAPPPAPWLHGAASFRGVGNALA